MVNYKRKGFESPGLVVCFYMVKNQVESKSHKVSIAGSGNVSGTYRPRNLYKQRWGKSPHNILAKFRS